MTPDSSHQKRFNNQIKTKRNNIDIMNSKAKRKIEATERNDEQQRVVSKK